MITDLHLHSSESDGTLTPVEVVQQASVAGVRLMALTDHDTLGGFESAAPLASELGITFLPAVELNTDASGLEVDILAYFLELPPEWFLETLLARQSERIRRAEAIVSRLGELGYPISYDRVREIAQGIVARPHIAQVMIEQGYASSQREVYDRFIGFGAPAYVERDELDPVTAIHRVQAAGGLAVVAHPGLVGNDDYLNTLIEAGADGLEAYYAFHTPEQVERYLKLAAQHDLVVSAGTDAHGPGRAKSHPIGVEVPDAFWPALRERLEVARRRVMANPPAERQERE